MGQLTGLFKSENISYLKSCIVPVAGDSNSMLDHTFEARVIIRFVPGITFLPEGIQKFLYPDDLGVGRFIAIDISHAGFWAGWRHLSLLDWAACSRHADLGNGFLLYPCEAFGSILLLFTVSAIIVFHKSSFKQVALPVHLATIVAGIGLIFTFFAAFIMISIRTMKNNEMLLHKAFDRFRFWGLLRAIARLCSFIACVWTFTKNDFNAEAL